MKGRAGSADGGGAGNLMVGVAQIEEYKRMLRNSKNSAVGAVVNATAV